jgi:N-acetylglutamate synthase-like GNAT family acetyltransferase
MDLVIRRARRSDKRDVLAAVRTIWGGQDRIPGVFDRWVTHRAGPFFVAESGGRVVGMGKLTILNEDEGWLEGGRVAPRWRRRGIATALIAHRIAVARERGIRLLRFSTASDNLPIHRAARRFGFRRVAVMWRHRAPATAGEPPARARAADIASVAVAVDPYIQVGRGWEWRTLTAWDLLSAIRRGQAFIADGAGAAAIVGSRDEDSLPLLAIGGRGRALRDLLVGLRAEARRRGLEDVSFYAASAAQSRAARSAGYRPPWSGRAYLFEKRFKT